MKFVQVVEGFAIRIDSIISVKNTDDETLVIETDGASYTVKGNFNMFMQFIEEEEGRGEEMDKLTKQFFGG